MKLTLPSIVSLAVLSWARAAPETHAVHERRESTPARWTKLGRVPSHVSLPMRVGLAQTNLDNAHEYLMDVSHPKSPNYGKLWTSEQVIEAFKPSDDAIEAVYRWLVDSGINKPSLSQNKAWFAFDATAERAEALLHTEYHEYLDLNTGGVMPACERYHIPKHIQKHIDYITPGIKLLAPIEGTKPEHGTLSKRQWPSGRSGWGSGWQGQGRPGSTWPKYHPAPQPPPKDHADLSQCDVAITPACVAALYDIPPATKAAPGNTMGIFEAELQFWDQYDLDSFFWNITGGRIPNGTHPTDHDIDGGVAVTTNVSAAGGEAMLDLELSYPIVYPQTITVWNVDDLKYQTWANDTYTWGFNTLLDAIDGSYCTYSAYGETGDLEGVDPTYPDPGPEGYNGTLQCGVFKSTNVISLSYGGQEFDVPIAYQKRQCNEYLKLGLQGVSFIFASGDAGVGDYPKPDGTGCLGPDNNIFNPTWPVNCPYVTAVGATKVYPGHTVFEPESAVFDPAGSPYSVNYSSGGGFSNIFAPADYQKSAIDTFFAEHNPQYPSYSQLAAEPSNPYIEPDVTALSGSTGGIYNRIGRGYPDVAANGDNIATYNQGVYGLSGGTSASTPIFGSIINRINEERIAVGKSPVGFLNPTLYAHPEVLNDITNGTNPNCGTVGFSAVKGWDPVTGIGTPNYPKLLELFLSLP
ncbi:protease S8 tripeptidyl peptidase I protein [Teratosphaeria destructans]|uniref:tripeptidyl-peptidase II n=1 Tax=Teratosphaeria destructans TaxID=418781 RepID=A0A9W7SUV2_9PEZI|nr:protease S8 tripeptidyl peptidase I protein [Teratosphaeria destructans]